MDAVMLLEILDAHERVLQQYRFHSVGASCRIGRDLHCDVVLDDPYAAAEHTLLTLQADGKVHVQDLGTHNGTRLYGERIAPVDGVNIEQGILLIGRTHVRIRTSYTALAPERLFQRNVLRRHRTLFATLGVVGSVGFAVFTQWLSSPASLLAYTLGAALACLLLLALWTGIWALIAHLNHGLWQVRTHLALAANCVAICAWGYWLNRFAQFATQWSWLAWLLPLFLATVTSLATYLHLRNATYLAQRLAWSIASVVTLTLAGMFWLAYLQIEPRNVNRIDYGPAVYPDSLRIAPATDVADYLSDANNLQRAANRNRQTSLAATPLLGEDE